MLRIRLSKAFLLVSIIFALTCASASFVRAQEATQKWTPSNTLDVSQELNFLRDRNITLGNLSATILGVATENWDSNTTVPYDYNAGTNTNPKWTGTKSMLGGKIYFHDKERKEFTLVLASREEFISRCRVPGEMFGYTFVQVIHGKWKRGKGYELKHFTIPLQGPREFGDIRYEDVDRFNYLTVYNRYRASIEIKPELKLVAETIQKYETHMGAAAWREKSIGGEAQMTKCSSPALSAKTNP